jgi:hypothetical protein
METTENNRLIAEFMKWDVKRPSTIPSNLHLSNLELDNGELFEPLFHSSWDWLMPVVQKCYKIDNEEGFDNLVDAVSTLDIDTTYNEVIEFIKWYNKNLVG